MKRTRVEVTEYKPPREIAEVAERRAMDIYRQWAWLPSNTISKLVTSLYLQGLNDAIDVIK